MMQRAKFFILIFLIALSQHLVAQGCNDAGLCTFGEFGTARLDDHNRFNTEISYVFGLGEKENLINILQLDQSISIFKDKGRVFVRLPFTYVYGKLGQTAGIGDVTVGMDITLFQKEEIQLSAMAGARLPPNDANISKDGRGLPMAYQTSLGTYDMMLGANMNIKKWRVGAGYQKPFGSNGNTFLHEYWDGNEDAMGYWESNQLKRGDDAMLRVDRYFTVREKNTIIAGLMAVCRLQMDQVERDGAYSAVEGTAGITLNASIGYNIAFQQHGALRVLLAAPIITRHVRPDGLTRTVVFSATYVLGSRKKDVMVEIP